MLYLVLLHSVGTIVQGFMNKLHAGVCNCDQLITQITMLFAFLLSIIGFNRVQ